MTDVSDRGSRGNASNESVGSRGLPHYYEEYHRGFLDGLAAYAHSKDGAHYVGMTGKTLREAGAQAAETWNYSPWPLHSPKYVNW